jgi:uncharacterized membrane protein
MAEAHPNSRLEAFCDGVFAIAMTLLILDIRIPSAPTIQSSRDAWFALGQIAPSLFAFLLSFTIIFITWVNHHGSLKLVNKSSAPFVYANGFLLLTVVLVPFPTALLGEYLPTEHAAPAVVIFNFVTALQAVAWVLLSTTALKGGLTRNEGAALTMRKNLRNGYFAVGVYSLLALTAFWLPIAVALLTTALWAFWLIWGILLSGGQGRPGLDADK